MQLFVEKLDKKHKINYYAFMTIETLKQMGFSEKTAKIYLAGLASGTSSVQTLAKKSGLKRSTIYPYLDELVEQGLMEKIPSGKKVYFKVISPKHLEQRAQAQLDTVRSNMLSLLELSSEATGKPKVTVLEGKKALEQLYDEIINANSIRFWSNLSKYVQLFPETHDKINDAIVQKQIRTREIIANTPEAKASAKKAYVTTGKHYSVRVATEGEIENDSAIVGNVVILFRVHEYDFFAVRIEDASIAKTMKSLFDMAWQSARPFIG